MRYLPFVDGLRAVAIAAVVTYHAVPWLVPGGFAGVDVFFVISGFLITRFIAAEIADGTFSMSAFLVRRARRLMPAALVCFAVVSALSAIVLLPDAFLIYGRSLLASLLTYSNFFFYRTAGYFSAPSLEKPLLHTWSLAVEDQFYLTWPVLLMLAASRLSRPLLIVLTSLLMIASLWLAEHKLAVDPDFVFYLLPTRAWELLLGAIIALAATHIVLPAVLAEGLGIAGIGAIVASFAVLSSAVTFPGFTAVPACVGTAAIIVSGLNQSTLVSRFLSLKGIVFVGLVSYSLYLWHWPLIALTSYWLERPLNGGEAVAVISASALIACLSWKYVEQPFRAQKHYASHAGMQKGDWNFVRGCLAGVVVIASIAGIIKVTRGAPQRYDSAVRTMLQQLVSVNPLRGTCDNYDNIFAHDAICNFGRKKQSSESYEIALFGDSMGDQWASLVLQFADQKNLAGRQVTNGGCSFLLGVKLPADSIAKENECASYQRQALKFIDANQGLKLVVVSASWMKWLELLENPDSSAKPNRATSTLPVAQSASLRFEQVLSDTLAVFTERGVKVLLIGQAPTYSSLPLRCLVTAVKKSSDTNRCGMPKAEALAQLQNSNAALKRIGQKNPMVTVSLPIDYICQNERCSLTLQGTLLYRDFEHLNQAGSVALGKYITFPELP